MSAGAIVIFSVLGLLVAVGVPLRIDVARQRRAVETARARLAIATVRRRAEGVPVEAVLKIGERVVHVSRVSTLTLADNGLYCLSDDGRWGGRVLFAGSASGPGDFALAAPPVIVKDRGAGADLPAWLTPALAELPADGLVLPVQSDLAWFAAVPDADGWHAALTQALRAPR